MITYTTANIFDSTAQTLVNPVNCRNVMGAGLAKEFARRYPGIDIRGIRIGELRLCGNVLCFPTKDDWRKPSKLEYIHQGLLTFLTMYRNANITSISFPMLGCGLGGLHWDYDVRPLMEKHLSHADIPVFIHIPA